MTSLNLGPPNIIKFQTCNSITSFPRRMNLLIFWFIIATQAWVSNVAGKLTKNVELPANNTNSRQNYLPSAQSFLFQVICGSLDNISCAEAKIGLSRVGRLIANDIKFLVPINVHISFEEFTLWNYGNAKYVVYIRPPIAAQKKTGKILGQILSYPNTLVKQHDFSRIISQDLLSKVYSYTPHDLSIILNTQHYTWNFAQSTTLTNEMVDFECLHV